MPIHQSLRRSSSSIRTHSVFIGFSSLNASQMPTSTVKQRFERTLEYVIGKLVNNALNLPRPVPALRHRPYLQHPPHRLRRRMQLSSAPPELIDILTEAYVTSLSHRYLFDRRSWGEAAQRREDGFERRFGRDEALWKKDVSLDVPLLYRQYPLDIYSSRILIGSHIIFVLQSSP